VGEVGGKDGWEGWVGLERVVYLGVKIGWDRCGCQVCTAGCRVARAGRLAGFRACGVRGMKNRLQAWNSQEPEGLQFRHRARKTW
jgi:hypothetical protein